LLCVVLSVFVANAQQVAVETHTFNLQDCINYAYEHQDSLKNARLDVESAKYKVKETIGIGLPQVSGTANLQDYLKVPTTLLPGEFFNQPGTYIPVKFGVKYQSSVGVNINQLIFDGSYLVGLQASKTYTELSTRNYNRTKVQATVALTKAYYQVLVNDEQIKLLDANISQLKQQLNETSQMNKQGFVEKIDVDRLTVLLNNLMTTRSNTVRLLALGYQMLKFQMGMPIEEQLIVTDKIGTVQLDPAAAVAMTDSTAYKNRVEYSLLETSRKLNELNVKRLKSQYLPSLAAFGTSSYSFQNNNFGDLYDRKFPTSIVGLQLNIPIFKGFQQKYRIKQAEIEVKKSDNILDMLKNGINLQIESSRIMYTNGLESLNNQKQNMDLAREVLRVTRIKYEQGVGSNIEVTQAQTQLQESENNYIQALYTALISKVDLDTAYGNIK
jgi:outer membrane protein TolC